MRKRLREKPEASKHTLIVVFFSCVQTQKTFSDCSVLKQHFYAPCSSLRSEAELHKYLISDHVKTILNRHSEIRTASYLHTDTCLCCSLQAISGRFGVLQADKEHLSFSLPTYLSSYLSILLTTYLPTYLSAECGAHAHSDVQQEWVAH